MSVRPPLASAPDVAQLIEFKADLLWRLRVFLREHDYWETPMPVLHRTREGAPIDQWSAVAPWGGERWYLRHCMEDHLRRAAAAHPRVYEIGKAIRAERPDATHAHEFLVLELVGRQVSYPEGIELIRQIFTGPVAAAVQAVYGHTDMFVDVAVKTWRQVLAEATGIGVDEAHYVRAVHDWMKDNSLPQSRPYASTEDAWPILEDATSLIIEPACTKGLTIVTDFPAPIQHVCDISPERGGTAMRLSAIFEGVELSDGGVKFANSAGYRRVYRANAIYRSEILGLSGNELPEEFFDDLDALADAAFTSGVGIDRICSVVAGVPISRALIFPEG